MDLFSELFKYIEGKRMERESRGGGGRRHLFCLIIVL